MDEMNNVIPEPEIEGENMTASASVEQPAAAPVTEEQPKKELALADEIWNEPMRNEQPDMWIPPELKATPVAGVVPPYIQQPVYAQPQQPQYVQPVYTQPQQPQYTQPVYAQPQQPLQTEPKNTTSKIALIGFILGIVGLCTFFVPMDGLLMSITALVIGIICVAKRRQGKSKLALTFGIIGVVLGLIMNIVFFAAWIGIITGRSNVFSDLYEEFVDEYVDDYDDYDFGDYIALNEVPDYEMHFD